MLNFRIWGSEARGSQKSVAVCKPMNEYIKPQHPVFPVVAAHAPTPSPSQPSSRRRRSSIECVRPPSTSPVAKRPRLENNGDNAAAQPRAPPTIPDPCSGHGPARIAPPAVNVSRVREVINNELGHEILLKHNELRLIEQELAKCQIALEQLRRCHLIPYPVNCPSPDQVVDIMEGKGPALQTQPGAPVPQWAPPFGVVDGPYARHYAKWLIPDPTFDGIQVDFHVEARQKSSEGRTTRNSYSESFLPGKRPARGLSGQKLQALSSGYPVKSDKAGPCSLVRQLDGIRVKLVCLDCNRENFSSTQGFINHCRIAHKRDYKSHEEAARKCGQPIAPEAGVSTPVEEKPASVTSLASAPAPAPAPAPTQVPAPVAPLPGLPSSSAIGHAHPFARPNLSEQETYVALQARIQDCIKMFEDGLHPYSSTIPCSQPSRSRAVPSTPSGFLPSCQTPHLSNLLRNRSIAKDLDFAVQEAKKVEIDDSMSEDSEYSEVTTPVATKGSGIMRIPTLPRSPAPDFSSSNLPSSSKGRGHLPFGATHPLAYPTSVNVGRDVLMPDVEDSEGDLSPNAMSSNNAPSLVSDDGEYEESEVPSDSEAGDSITGNSVSDVAEITLEDDGEGRTLRHHRSSSGAGPETVRFRKDDVKHVTFVSPIKSEPKPARNASQGRGRKM